jgi:DNA-binding LacI/PurR family transcriptional regulator
VAKAISQLVAEGLLYRIKRKGTFINMAPASAKQKINRQFVGILMPLGGICSPFLKMMCEKIWSYGYETIALEYTGQHDVERLFRELVAQCSGIILSPDGETRTRHLLDEAKQQGIKIVLLDVYYPNLEIGYVASDNFDAGFKVTRHLIDGGRKRIAFVAPSLMVSSQKERLDGYQKALREEGMEFDENLQLILHQPMDELYFMWQVPFGLLQIMKNFISKNCIDAMIFSAHMHLFIALQAIRELELKIPKDIALAAFDRYLVDEFIHPSITVVEQALDKASSEAVDMLINLVKGSLDTPLYLRLPTKLIVRESSGQTNLT